ncbi:phosphotransferase [Candidatus Pelagibacter sp.]|nr:phosphotransferase [Candidatus Pelagibacter sp.]
MNLNHYKKLSGDASFRSFYRSNNSVIVYSKKEQKINLLIYDAINRLLLKNKINAPKLLKENYDKNYIVIEDLGDKTVLKTLKKKNQNKIEIYKKIFLLLIKIQKISKEKTLTFKKSYYHLPKYSEKKLIEESNLFTQWYLPTKLPKNEIKKVKNKLDKIFKKLLSKLKIKKKVLVHRDFHISNIMFYKNKLFLIDSQDAVFGNPAYDLASLIDDVRFKTTRNFKNHLLQTYFKLNKKINIEKLKNDFEILSVLRNLKIIGIFTRLSLRDKKHKYLKFIPYAWKLIQDRSEDIKFKELNVILNNYFLKKKRLK